MAVYAIGDVQGCFDELQRLLERIRFDPAEDRLWFVGDLVNRGPKSLEVLRFVKGLKERAATVLGNHDLHLLAVALGAARRRYSDTLDAVLKADDREELVSWLRFRPLLHYDPALAWTLIHAGLPPQWDLPKAKECAAEVEAVLRGYDHTAFLANMYGNMPSRWSEVLSGWDRLRFIVNCFTRLRYCDAAGHLALEEKGPPGTQPPHILPWFTVPGRASLGINIVFGHWSTLGSHRAQGILALDSGCLWGGCLTAARLDGDGELISVPCPGARRPGHA
jgi:bis(5''-nucleosyl)-tetraphosphatase (symmetrical)